MNVKILNTKCTSLNTFKLIITKVKLLKIEVGAQIRVTDELGIKLKYCGKWCYSIKPNQAKYNVFAKILNFY